MSSTVDQRFDGVAQALARGADAVTACAVVGQDLARDGVDLGAALTGLAHTATAVTGADPGYAAVHALSVAWADETLAFLHDVSCESPLSGVASRSHLRARLAEIHRAARLRGTRARDTHVLVVVDAPAVDAAEHFERSLRLARVAEICRDAFRGGETLAQVHRHRLVVLAERDDLLGVGVARLRVALRNLPDLPGSRVSIERVVDTDDEVPDQLGALAR